MLRTKTCGELRLSNVGETVTLAGWVQRSRKMGGMTFIDLRDRYGITQLVADEQGSKEIKDLMGTLGREYVIQTKGVVRERESKNCKIETGEIEVDLTKVEVLSPAATPPFTIEDNTDGGEDLRAQYRYFARNRE